MGGESIVMENARPPDSTLDWYQFAVTVQNDDDDDDDDDDDVLTTEYSFFIKVGDVDPRALGILGHFRLADDASPCILRWNKNCASTTSGTSFCFFGAEWFIFVFKTMYFLSSSGFDGDRYC